MKNSTVQIKLIHYKTVYTFAKITDRERACSNRSVRPPSLSKPQHSAHLPFLAAEIGPESVLT